MNLIEDHGENEENGEEKSAQEHPEERSDEVDGGKV